MLFRKSNKTDKEISGDVVAAAMPSALEEKLKVVKFNTAKKAKKLLRNYSDHKEAVIGVDITPSCIRVCQMNECEEGKWELIHLASTQVEVSPVEAEDSPEGQTEGSFVGKATKEDIRDFPEKYVAALQKLLKDNGMGKQRHAALPIPVSSAVIKTVTLPMMSDEDIDQAIEMGSLWESFVELPGDPADYAIFYEVIKRDAESQMMDMLFVAAKQEEVELYTSIVEKAGLHPTIVDVRCFALNNAFGINGDNIAELGQVAFLKIDNDKNYVHVIDDGEPFLYDIFLSPQERENIEELISDEEFLKRYMRQVKQLISTHETKHHSQKITHIYVVSVLSDIDEVITKMKVEIPEYTVCACEFFDHITIPEEHIEQVNAVRNRSRWAVVMGLAVRKLDVFSHYKGVRGADNVNLLPDVQHYKDVVRKDVFGRVGVAAMVLLMLGFLGLSYNHIAGEEGSIKAQLGALDHVEVSYNSKIKKSKNLYSIVKKMDSLNKIRSELPTNQDLLITVYNKMSDAVPYGVWLENVEFTAPNKLIIKGNSLADQNILQFIRVLSGNEVFAKVSLKNMYTVNDKKEKDSGKPLKAFTLNAVVNDNQDMS